MFLCVRVCVCEVVCLCINASSIYIYIYIYTYCIHTLLNKMLERQTEKVLGFRNCVFFLELIQAVKNTEPWENLQQRQTAQKRRQIERILCSESVS